MVVEHIDMPDVIFRGGAVQQYRRMAGPLYRAMSDALSVRLDAAGGPLRLFPSRGVRRKGCQGKHDSWPTEKIRFAAAINKRQEHESLLSLG